MKWSGAYLLLICTFGIVLAAGCTQPAGNGQAAVTTTPAAALQQVRLETTMGNITIALDPDMPVTTGNFLALTKSGFYNNVTFHRVIAGYIVQAGDPTGTGRGGPGYTIPDEFTAHNHNLRGTVAMANKGVPDTGSSQFFINLRDNTGLDAGYPVFGTVTEGMEVADAISRVPVGDKNRPVDNVTILRAYALP
jgi:Peptidyl-prolyl cis-trans isomerase (rotamase) - cyclophilin family